MTGPINRKNREESARGGAHQEHLHDRNEDNVPQDKNACSHGSKEQQDKQPPPLTAAAQELIDNDIRGSTKVTYKSKVRVFPTYCTKAGTNTKSCHPNTVIKFLTMLA